MDFLPMKAARRTRQLGHVIARFSCALVLFTAACSPALAAGSWMAFGRSLVRFADGHVQCASVDASHCVEGWTVNQATAQEASLRPLVCGEAMRRLYGFDGYAKEEHWCNRAYSRFFAKWEIAPNQDNVLYSVNPMGDIQCLSANNRVCVRPNFGPVNSNSETDRPLVCGAMHQRVMGFDGYSKEGHWCNAIRRFITQEHPALATMATIRKLDYAEKVWLTAEFNYETSWAGAGFGLSGTQRGAPEYMEIETQEGHTGLAINSLPRDAEWYAAHPEARGDALYNHADGEAQDDLFMYSNSWVAADEPAVVMHLYKPSGNITSMRMTTKLASGASSWPGIWVHDNHVGLRGPGRHDISVDTTTMPGHAVDSWLTLGMRVTPTGDLRYYLAYGWVDDPFRQRYFLGSNKTLSAANSMTHFPVVSQADAIVMNSNVFNSGEPNVIGSIVYAKKVAPR